jgi:hypothetical protein
MGLSLNVLGNKKAVPMGLDPSMLWETKKLAL